MVRFYLFLVLIGCAVAGGAYGLWYEFGPESAPADLAMMRQYRMSQLTDAQLKAMVAAARRKRAIAIADDREMRERFWKEYGERLKAWETASAQCETDEIFKLRNEDLCNRPLGPGLAGMSMLDPDGRVESEEQYIEWEIMFRCTMAPLTIREARRAGCLPPK
jgi:hypothetical protein